MTDPHQTLRNDSLWHQFVNRIDDEITILLDKAQKAIARIREGGAL